MSRVTIRGLLSRKLRLALTALAIVLGVTFITGTLVLGDTLDRTFNNLVGTAYQHVSFVVRGRAELSGTSAAETSDRRPVPASLAAAIRRVPGVAYVYGAVGGYAQFMDRDGNAIGSGGTSTLGFSFDSNTQLSPYRLVQGRAPTGPDQVVMDKATATKHHFAVGDRVLINLPGGARYFRISGIVKYGSSDSLAGLTLAGFDLRTAQALFDLRGRYDSIDVLAAPSANTVRLQSAIARTLPSGVQVVSGQTAAGQLSTEVDNELSFISTALLIFGAVALFVGAFTIVNTFSITVEQRTRELALLRLVGASRGQVFRSVLSEAALTGVAASLIGLGLGVLAALGLKALLKAFGIALPSAPLVFEARTPIVAIAVGVGVTMLSALIPAQRAVRIAPVAALSSRGEHHAATVRRRRLIAGVALAALAVLGLAFGVSEPSAGLAGLGAFVALLATITLVPAIAGPLAGGLGRPAARVLGAPGRLGRENASRNPGRTAQTSAALMIGIALVSTIAVIGASLSTSTKDQIDSAVTADYLVTGNGGFSTSVVPAVSHLPGVTTATTVYQGQFEFRGSLFTLVAATPTRLGQTVQLQIEKGSGAAAMAAGDLLVDSMTAQTDNLHVGSLVPVKFARTGSTTMRIGGIYATNPLLGSYLTGASYFLAHFENPLPIGVLLRTAPGTPDLNPALNNRILVPYANVSSKTRAQFEHDQLDSINTLLNLIYVLLALAVLVALIGIVNTLMLSVFERTREIGLLRAVGMRRRQVRAMIRSESVIIALLGAVVGIVIGTGAGVALASSLRNSGITAISVPLPRLIAFLIVSAVLGLSAAAWPARRAANLDVLSAIAAE